MKHDVTDPVTETVAVDRTRCAGRGVCAELLPGRFVLDEWGYPIASTVELSADDGRLVSSGCPVRALYRSGRGGPR